MAKHAQSSFDLPAPESAEELDRRQTIGRIAGGLFVIGAGLSLPSALLVEPPPPSSVYLIMAAAFLSGLFFMFFPWDRRSARWLHAIVIVGTLEISLGIRATGVHGSLYSWLYMLIAIGVAYSFRSRKVIAAYLLLITLAMATQLIDTPLTTREVLRNIFVSIPSLLLSCGVIVYFRERLESGHRAYRRLARLDPLTGVGNYRTLHERLDYEIARHERHGRSFAVILVDLDSFKQVNERHGHLAGDDLLRSVGRQLLATVRDEDTVCRQGGDEFSVLVPEAGEAEAMMLAGRLREALAELSVAGRPLGSAAGWAVYPQDGSTAETVLARADAVLLQAKHGNTEHRQHLAQVHPLRPRDASAPAQR